MRLSTRSAVISNVYKKLFQRVENALFINTHDCESRLQHWATFSRVNPLRYVREWKIEKLSKPSAPENV